MPIIESLALRKAASAAVRPTTRVATVSAVNAGLAPIVRLGYIVRGILYALSGMLALRVALGRPSEDITPATSIELIGHEPFGRVMLIVIAVGLAGYALWGVIRAVFDPLHKGHSSSGIAQRIGYAISAMAYLGLLAATYQYAVGPLSHMAGARDWTSAILAKPLGEWLVAILGVGWILGAGLAQIVSGWRGSFLADLALERMSPSDRLWANRLGRLGIVARGAVFTVVGALMVAAAMHAGPHGKADMGGALIEIMRQPFGRALLGAAAIGLIAFGAFSVMCARWMRIHPAAHLAR